MKKKKKKEKEKEEEEEEEEEKKEEEKSYAEYACRYCGIENIDSVLQCSYEGCMKWFCNSTLNCNGSHIIFHLIKSKHREISLHENSPLGDTTLECYNCGSKNVFLLGFIPAPEEGVVVLLCREPCLSNNVLMKDSQWDFSLWQPLIENRKFLDWLVKVPEGNEKYRYKNFGVNNMDKLEDLWKIDSCATMDDVLNKRDFSALKNIHNKNMNNNNKSNMPEEDDIRNVMLSYEDGYMYQNIIAPLVQIEAVHDKMLREGQKQDNVTVRWDIGLNKKRYAIFKYAKEDSDIRFIVGDEMQLSCTYKQNKWIARGLISKINISQEITLELKGMSIGTAVF